MKYLNNSTILIALSTLVTGLALGWLIFGGKPSTEHKHELVQEGQKQVWTCSMHPSVRQNEPGKCPICGMDLIPLDTDHGEEGPLAIRMSATAMKLANIQTSLVSTGKPLKEIRLNGKVQTDEKSVFTQTSHIAGRIEKLMVSITGEYVKKGQVIAQVYSPDLVIAQKELFEAYRIRDSQPELYQAAREKLSRWKLSSEQIDGIINNGKPQGNFPISADVSGVVINKSVNLGDYVKQGSALYEIADLSRLWILFDVYESEMPWVRVGDEIEYTVQSLPGVSFNGIIDFIDPVINSATRVAKARLSVRNQKSKLKPEMFVSGKIISSMEQDQSSIIIPKSAVMWTGKRSLVYVKKNTEAGITFEMREVTLGPSLGDNFQIETGLKKGEEIATHGTFSIDAAAQLAGKPSMMSPQGGAVIMDHQHSIHAPTNENQDQHKVILLPISISQEAKHELSQLLDSYLQLKDAFVNDDFETSINEAQKYKKVLGGISMSLFEGEAHQVWMEQGMPLGDLVNQIVNAEDITSARKPFKPLSEHMIRLVQVFHPIEKSIYVQHCPMADDFKGADWLSLEDNIMNPYYGASMLTCGEIKDTISTISLNPDTTGSKVKSPHTAAMATIGDNHVHIDYSSPRVRGRKIFGGLVAYNEVWSTGAHNATSISFSKDVKVDKEIIKAGKYALFTIPGKDKWTVILNTNWDQHLADEYNKEDDVIRIKIESIVSESITEELTFKVIPIDQNSGKIQFQWEHVSFTFNISNN